MKRFLPVAVIVALGAIVAVVVIGSGDEQAPRRDAGASTRPVVTQAVDPETLPNVGDGTEEIQIPQEIPQVFVDRCRERLHEHPGDQGCELLVKAAKGEIKPGVYPESRRDELLAD